MTNWEKRMKLIRCDKCNQEVPKIQRYTFLIQVVQSNNLEIIFDCKDMDFCSAKCAKEFIKTQIELIPEKII